MKYTTANEKLILMKVHFLGLYESIFFKLVFSSATEDSLVKNLAVIIAMLCEEGKVHHQSLLTQTPFLVACCLNKM